MMVLRVNLGQMHDHTNLEIGVSTKLIVTARIRGNLLQDNISLYIQKIFGKRNFKKKIFEKKMLKKKI